MKTESEIVVRMNELREIILVINEKLNEELKKQRGQRDYRYLKFLNKEHHLWNQVLHQLEWIVCEQDPGIRINLINRLQ